MKIIQDIKLDFADVLIRPKRSTLGSRNEVDLEREFIFPHSKRVWKGIPIIAANMDTTGTIEMYRVLSKYKMITCLHKFYEVSEYPLDMDPNYFMISSGIGDKDWEKLQLTITRLNPYFVCVDVANGYSSKLLDFVKKVRAKYPDITLAAGNVVTGELVEELKINGGVDIIKIGIGPGSVCTTRLQTGCGFPQLSAIMECSDAAHGVDAQIISDGGIKCPGDIGKAIGAGADFVMIGSMFSGHEESGGELIEEKCPLTAGKQQKPKKYKVFYGMSSTKAMMKHYGKVNSYRSSEGKVVKIPYRGPVENTVIDMLGGLRSTCTYVGAKKLKNLPKCTTFIRVNRQVNNIYSGSEHNFSE